jgi:hypothetical protein
MKDVTKELDNIDVAFQALGVAQHHVSIFFFFWEFSLKFFFQDAVSGTEKQHVANVKKFFFLKFN